jgi:hypothetical protein
MPRPDHGLTSSTAGSQAIRADDPGAHARQL